MTVPPRWIIPKIGGFSLFRVPRPRAPFRRRRQPFRSFFHRLWMSFMPGHDIDLIAFHVAPRDGFDLASNDTLAEWLGHPLDIVRVQRQPLGNLCVREV